MGSSASALPGLPLPVLAETQEGDNVDSSRPGTAQASARQNTDDGNRPLPWDDLEKDLQCGVCITPLHKCLTLVPCGHNFCSVCFVRWRRRSAMCPECRTNVRQAVRNHALDCVVEAFSKANPEAARSKQDIMAMDRAERDASNQAVLKWLLRGEPVGASKSAVDR